MPKIIINLDDNLYSSIVNHRAKTKYQEHIDYEDLKNAVEDGIVLNECKAEDCISRKDFLETCKKYCDINCDYLPAQRQFMCSSCMMGDAIMFAEDALSVYPKSDAEDITFKDDNAVSRFSMRDILCSNAYELEYPDSPSEHVVNRDEAIKYLMELPSIYPKKEDYIKANDQLKKQIEMLKLDRDCTMSVLEDIKAKLIEIKEHYDYVSTSDVIKLIDKHCGKEQE